MKKFIFFIAIIILIGKPLFAADKAAFPGSENSIDPTKRYSIEWQASQPEEKTHRLFLKKERTGERRELQEFVHSADVYWAPDGNAVAITEWGGAAVSDITIYFPDRPDVTVNMQEVLARSFRKIPFVRDNQEVSFEFLGWQNAKVFHFKVSGKGAYNPDGFEKYFEYTLNGKAREIKKSSDKQKN